MSEPSPLDRLKALGGAEPNEDWPDYLGVGIGPEHIPELIRMASVWCSDQEPDADGPEWWAPVHAWRALGQLGAVEPSPRLVQVRSQEENLHGDWAGEELPEVFGRMGERAVPILEQFLADASLGMYTRWCIADGLKRIAERQPASRAACVAALVKQLERASENDPGLNAGLISALLDLKAVEAAPVIEQAYATNNVDESIPGDWEYAQYDLGLRSEPPPRPYQPAWPVEPARPAPGHSGSPKARAQERAKAKRKETRKARKKNRKKK